MEVVLVRREPTAPSGETTAVRLLGLLPAHLTCAPEVGRDKVRLRIEYGAADDVHGAVAAVLADSALRGWAAEGA